MKTTVKKIAAIAAAMVLILSLAACGNTSDKPESGSTPDVFPSFTATDMSGNKVTEQTFKEHSVTVLNIWFTGCAGCVEEMPNLEKISEKLKEKDGQMVGLCLDAADEETKKQALKILNNKGVSYTNLAVDSSSDAQKYLDSITAFPTTLLVDRNGNIIGDAVVGSIDTQKQIDAFMKRVNDIVAKDGGQK